MRKSRKVRIVCAADCGPKQVSSQGGAEIQLSDMFRVRQVVVIPTNSSSLNGRSSDVVIVNCSSSRTKTVTGIDKPEIRPLI